MLCFLTSYIRKKLPELLAVLRKSQFFPVYGAVIMGDAFPKLKGAAVRVAEPLLYVRDKDER